MQRRDFLGSMIGTVLGTTFVAKQASPATEGRYKVIPAALWCGALKPEHCTSQIRVGDLWIDGPNYASHEFKERSLEIKFQDLKLDCELVIVEFAIVSPKKQSQCCSMHSIHYLPGDILKLTYTVAL